MHIPTKTPNNHGVTKNNIQKRMCIRIHKQIYLKNFNNLF